MVINPVGLHEFTFRLQLELLTNNLFGFPGRSLNHSYYFQLYQNTWRKRVVFDGMTGWTVILIREHGQPRFIDRISLRTIFHIYRDLSNVGYISTGILHHRLHIPEGILALAFQILWYFARCRVSP